tara:strand:- start:245 stop:1075 length:831 start_codon:yes stop_codon:yes gene_type:complete
MDPIKNAFEKVKSDFSILQTQIKDLKSELSEIQLSILNLTKSFNKNPTTPNLKFDRQTDISTDNNLNPTNTINSLKQELNELKQQISLQKTQNQTSTHLNSNKTDTALNSTDRHIQTHSSTHNYPFQAFKEQKTLSSIGNEGVSTDRQTDEQTDISTHFTHKISEKPQINPSLILTQLDGLKKDLRFKIKKLTKQEMIVYSAIYQFEDQGHDVDYTLLSTNLGLSESSIRDYISRIGIKNLPLIKEKENNKKIILKIPQDLRKLATLDTIIKLRDL